MRSIHHPLCRCLYHEPGSFGKRKASPLVSRLAIGAPRARPCWCCSLESTKKSGVSPLDGRYPDAQGRSESSTAVLSTSAKPVPGTLFMA